MGRGRCGRCEGDGEERTAAENGVDVNALCESRGSAFGTFG